MLRCAVFWKFWGFWIIPDGYTTRLVIFDHNIVITITSVFNCIFAKGSKARENGMYYLWVLRPNVKSYIVIGWGGSLCTKDLVYIHFDYPWRFCNFVKNAHFFSEGKSTLYRFFLVIKWKTSHFSTGTFKRNSLYANEIFMNYDILISSFYSINS